MSGVSRNGHRKPNRKNLLSYSLVEALLRPTAVALYGASNDPKKNTGRPQRFLKAHGYPGRVVPINPNRETVQGEKAYAKAVDAPPGIEQALIMVPKLAVLNAVEDCAAAGVKVATIYSDGFAETGVEGLALQEKIVAIAKASGMRIAGPNSMGTIDLNTPMTLSINAILEMENLPAGNLGVISQSGSMLGALMSRGAARGIGFSSLLSIGNEADLGIPELIEVLVEDRNTEIILLFLEGVRDAEALGKASRYAYDAGKPVIAYKLGRSEVGRELAVSHSGAIAGYDAAIDAFLQNHGILRVEMMETLLELPALVTKSKPSGGNRVAVITTTGGGAAMVVDKLGAAGLELVPASERLLEVLAKNDLNLGEGRLIDLTMAGTREGLYKTALEVLFDDDNVDAVVAVVGSSGQFHPQLAVAPIIDAQKTGKPLATFIAPDAPHSLERLNCAGIAAFRTPEACADGVRALLDWKPPLKIPETRKLPTAVKKKLTVNNGPNLDEVAGREILKALGISTTQPVILSGPEAHIPDDLNYPLAVKVISPDLHHKTEAGGVALGIGNKIELHKAMKEVYYSAANYMPEASLLGIMVEPMIDAQAEVLLGFRRDVEAGPIVVLGMGGILAELYKDFSVRLAPINKDIASQMIEEVKGLSLIKGFRNLPKGDCDALANAIASLSSLALDPIVAEAEINPLMVRRDGEGVIAVDALVRLNTR